MSAGNNTSILRRKHLRDRDLARESDLAEALEDIKSGRVYGPYEAKRAIPALRKLIGRQRKQKAEEVGKRTARTRSGRSL